ncbi:T9SS type A sorting domain-containing protein [Flavobacterium faecale]|uniref:pectate lyase family protein n=1 Tax=Flavobacterium faecale TaxID=1355330 RepID=UPI003AABB2F4
MKKTLLLHLFLFVIFSATGQNYYMAQPEGFGAVTTGGGNANPVTVTTYAQLKTALTSTSVANAVILVSGTIDCVYTSVLLNNKTIIGLPGARLRNTQITVGDSPTSAANSGILYIKPGSSNVIIRNLIFEGPGAYDVDGRDNLTNEGKNVWVDHCEFQDGMDGNFDIKGTADNVTVSWCKFTYLKAPIAGGSGGSADHRFSGLIGSGITDFPTDGRFSVTLQNCYWAEGCKARMPRARNAEIHLINCYYKTSVSGASAIGLGAGNQGTTCYVENCNFEQVATISSPVNEGSGTTVVKFDGCIKGTVPTAVTGLDKGTATKPTYSYTVFPVEDVANFIANPTCGAGATLNVTADGVMSSCGGPLNVDKNALQMGINYYPTMIDSELNINFSDLLAGKTALTIYDESGKKVLSFAKEVVFHDTLTIDLSQLPKGLYLCHLKVGEKIASWKVIKK